MRRVTIPSSPSIPPAIGFVPWKSYRSQPSSSASASARWIAGSVSGVSIVPSSQAACDHAVGAAPVGAPLARALAAALAARVLHGASRADEQPEQLAQRRLVERAADAARRDAERDRARHLEQEEGADAAHVAVEVALGDACARWRSAIGRAMSAGSTCSIAARHRATPSCTPRARGSDQRRATPPRRRVGDRSAAPARSLRPAPCR